MTGRHEIIELSKSIEKYLDDNENVYVKEIKNVTKRDNIGGRYPAYLVLFTNGDNIRFELASTFKVL